MSSTAEFKDAPWIDWGLAVEANNDYTAEGELYAVEIEIESHLHSISTAYEYLSHTPANAWRVVEEGSLRGEGFELVSQHPDTLRNTLMSLSQVMPLFEDVQDTFRAAIHVHANVQGFTRERYARLLIGYYLREPELFKWVGDGRDESVFCVPWYQGNAHVHAIMSAYHNEDPHAWADAIHSSPKYSGLNLLATQTYGSVEFRHLQTPAMDEQWSVRRIADYVNRCASFIGDSQVRRGQSLMEYADWIAGHYRNVSPEHMCNVYSTLAAGLPIDWMAAGIPARTASGALGMRRVRRNPPMARRHTPSTPVTDYDWSVGVEVDFDELAYELEDL